LGRSVTLVCVDTAGVVHQAKTDSEKRALLDCATSKDLVLVAWPGQWSQEIYVVDDLRAARAAVRG
jgi:predicted GTPase